MKVTLTQIGNSKGIIIPSRLLKLLGLEKEVEMSVKNNSIVISNAHEPRSGWREAFQAAGAGDEEILMEEIENDFDKEEWDW